MKINYLLIPVLVFITAYAGSQVTGANLGWYQTLVLPAWTPSGLVISVVWTVIFILAAMSAMLAYNRSHNRIMLITVSLLFLVNAALNVTWSYLFFGLHRIDWALMEIFALELSVISLVVTTWKISRFGSLILLPYAAWVAFAAYLNYIILSLNY